MRFRLPCRRRLCSICREFRQKPLELCRLDQFDDDLLTIQKYAGKTNEHFTKLLVNVTFLMRSLADLLATALPVWRDLLRPGGAVGIARNTLLMPRREGEEILARAGFEVFDAGAYLGFQHRVDHAIVRDILVGQRP